VSSFEKVFVSAVNDWSGDRTEGKEVSDWIGIGSSVSEVMGILEYVSSIGLPLAGPFLNSFFSFICVGVAVEVALHRLRPS